MARPPSPVPSPTPRRSDDFVGSSVDRQLRLGRVPNDASPPPTSPTSSWSTLRPLRTDSDAQVSPCDLDEAEHRQLTPNTSGAELHRAPGAELRRVGAHVGRATERTSCVDVRRASCRNPGRVLRHSVVRNTGRFERVERHRSSCRALLSNSCGPGCPLVSPIPRPDRSRRALQAWSRRGHVSRRCDARSVERPVWE